MDAVHRVFRQPAGLAGIADAGRVDTYQMIRPRTAEAGFKSSSDAVFRATGITAYLEAGGTLENAQAMAAHESPRTTKLYDRTGDEITLESYSRILVTVGSGG